MHMSEHRPIRVLIIDDHRTVLWGLEKLVDSAKPRMRVVGAATSPDEALRLAAAEQPDVVLLDLDLGGTDGLGLVSGLRECCAAKVLIVTGAQDHVMRERAVLDGASGVVHKSERAEMILNAVERVAAGEIWLDRTTTAKLFTTLSDAAKGKHKKPATDASAALTSKERQIVAAVVQHKGAPIKVIADVLCLSSHTVRNHLASIYSKLGVHSRLELFMYAKERGLDSTELEPCSR